ncbi:hypothetical protein NDU88_003701 [Pleurodeles waltl]|uniref:Uncharacterized protein n=1 Tax=Pleurodeles waltl TaxID=8319 RepID=A0AAV7WQ67_PLEWA|nr:hypothetical protein NDU88_003701 [Pleurodeles waltl]
MPPRRPRGSTGLMQLSGDSGFEVLEQGKAAENQRHHKMGWKGWGIADQTLAEGVQGSDGLAYVKGEGNKW